jgi:transposase
MMIPLSRLPSDHLSQEALMARRSKAKGTRQRTKLQMIYTRAAGIDVGSTFHVVAVPPERAAEPVQTFQSFPGDLYRLATWLVEIGVTTVAMASTGIYWIPVFDILEAHGLEVLRVNAQHVKPVPGRKTDVNDAQWLQQLHTSGLLRGSFHPAQDWSALRVY